jgi:CheY-like chemotaxis protein
VITNASSILVVDDDEDIRDLVVYLLKGAGYDADAASDGLAALEWIRAHGRPAVVLLDLRMPRMSGFEFISFTKKDSELRELPIVVVSGDMVALEAIMPNSVNGYLKKPFDFARVLDVVRPFVGPSSRDDQESG